MSGKWPEMFCILNNFHYKSYVSRELYHSFKSKIAVIFDTLQVYSIAGTLYVAS